MELEQYGLADAGLIDGERIESAINLGEDSDDNKGVMLLTDRRVIHIHGDEKNRQAVFASIQDIIVVEVTMEREGMGAYVWAALSFLVALLLWRVIDNALGSVAAALLVALMGVYLIVDRVLSPGNPVAVFKTVSSEFRCELSGENVSPEIYDFINKLFQSKSESVANTRSQVNHFAPR